MRTSTEIRVTLSNPLSTHYEVLGVSPGEVGDEGLLRALRRDLMLEVHPDRNPDDGAAHAASARVNAAYTVLSDTAARTLYDASLRTTHVPCGVCEGAGYRSVQRGFTHTKKLRCLGCAGAGWLRKV